MGVHIGGAHTMQSVQQHVCKAWPPSSRCITSSAACTCSSWTATAAGCCCSTGAMHLPCTPLAYLPNFKFDLRDFDN